MPPPKLSTLFTFNKLRFYFKFTPLLSYLKKKREMEMKNVIAKITKVRLTGIGWWI